MRLNQFKKFLEEEVDKISNKLKSKICKLSKHSSHFDE